MGLQFRTTDGCSALTVYRDGEVIIGSELTAACQQLNQQVSLGPNMTFGEAIGALKLGHRVSRSGLNGKGMWLKLQVPDSNSKMTLPYIYMSTAQGDLIPWLASQTDVLAEDWLIVE